MKKMLVLLAAFAFSASAASAQTTAPAARHKEKKEHVAKAPKTPEQHADHTARRLTKTLNLTPEQAGKVRQLALAQAQEKQADRAKFAAAGTKAGMQAERKADRERYEAQLKQILSADQYAKYAQLRTERQHKHQQGMGPRKDKFKAKS
ncbi:hypothetical protein SAMN02745146_2792 [Hymenobacter daecheongensis DSM 21074]|uniref:DUF4890 domain-containing protein n=1 Tax=Hymenobacter daecheongensis DSM 21074 TaxID=1121955 RepID=A0A1M6I500_9BACT|nr:hypothetical protein [Hymenobacter daecheongensis]SHJ29470.1 hypothetical protein SAMN02745146_2792 [Hymenobacter daecheongensis DSM 21074]